MHSENSPVRQPAGFTVHRDMTGDIEAIHLPDNFGEGDWSALDRVIPRRQLEGAVCNLRHYP